MSQVKRLSSAWCWLRSWLVVRSHLAELHQQDLASIRQQEKLVRALRRELRDLKDELEESVDEANSESNRRGGLIRELRQELADCRNEVRRLTADKEVLEGTIEACVKQEAVRSAIADRIIAENTAAATRATTTAHDARDDI